jgi:predicted flap endonuclease-1-like 5' DNA nuclease
VSLALRKSALVEPVRVEGPAGAPPSLPISKLRGVPQAVRIALKQRRITNCDQLLATAARTEGRATLARAIGLDDESMLIVVQRADMARVNGIGAVFGLMLEDLGVCCVADLAAADPVELHERLRRHNQAERIARRSPTPEEVLDWVLQARRLPVIVS